MKGRPSKIESPTGRVCTFHPCDKNVESNAKLIAAAPELLEAFAKLIAAAPELLEALEICREAITRLDEDELGMYMREDGHGGIDYWPYTVELLQRIDTIIAKAKARGDSNA